MNNALQIDILIGDTVIMGGQIVTVEFFDDVDGPCVSVYGHGGHSLYSASIESPEGKALEWFYKRADRGLFDAGMTVDLLEEHRLALKAGTEPAIEQRPTIAVLPVEGYADMVRNRVGYPVGLRLAEGGVA